MTFLSEVSEVPIKPQEIKQNDIHEAYKSLIINLSVC